MSKQIDERVVKMGFDNKEFEKNVNQTISSLEQLKKSLNLSGASKGLEEVDAAAKNIDLSHVGDAVDAVRVKFSALQVMGMTAISNITTSATNAGKKIYGATMGQIIEGGKRRAQNIEQAKFQLEGLGVAWDSIKDDINYGVKDTAYGLDAAAKIASQLVASNVEVGDSMKTALRGVSGVAAMTSSEYEDIGRIFTTVAGNGRLMADQLNQIASRGLNAAAAIGKYLGVSEKEVREMTSKGKIDFETFAAAMDSAFGAHAKEANKTFSGAMSNVRAALSRIGADFATPYFDNLKNIFNALIPVIDNIHKKLQPLINLTSKAMTGVGDFVVKRLNSLSGALSGTSTWDKIKEKISGAGVAFDEFQNALITTAKAHDVAIDDMIAKDGSFEKTLKRGWLSSGIMGEALTKFADSLKVASGDVIDFKKIVDQVINGDWGNGIVRFNKLTEAGYEYATVQGLVNDVIYGRAVDWKNLTDAQLENMGYSKEQIQVIRDLAAEAEAAGTPLNDLIKSLAKPSIKFQVFSALGNLFKSLGTILQTVKIAWTETFNFKSIDVFGKIQSAISGLSDKFVISEAAINNLKRTFEGLFSALDIARNFIGGSFSIAFRVLRAVFSNLNIDVLSITATIGDAISRFRGWIKEHDLLGTAIKTAAKILQSFMNIVKDLINKLKSFPEVRGYVEKFKDAVKALFDLLKDHFKDGGKQLQDFIERFKSLDSLSLNNIKNTISDFGNNVVKKFFNFSGIITNVKNSVVKLKKVLSGKFEPVFEEFDIIKAKLSDFADFIKSKFTNIGLGEILTVSFGIALIASLKTMNDALDLFSQPLAALADMFDSVSGVLGQIGKTLKTYQKEIKYKIILNIAKAIGILAVSIALLSKMDQNNVWSATGALAALSGVLVGLTLAFSFVAGKLGNVERTSINIAAIAAGVALLAFSLKSISKMNMSGIAKSLIAVTTLILGLATAMRVIGDSAAASVKTAAVILSFAISIKILVSALKSLDKLNPSGKSLAILSGMMSSLAGLMAATRLASKGAVKAGAGLLAISAALFVMTTVLKRLNNMPVNLSIIGKLILIMGSLAALMWATKLAGENAGKAGLGMLGISASLMIMIAVFEKLSKTDIKVSGRMIVTLITIIGTFALLMLATRAAGEHALKAGVSLLAMSVAIGLLAGVMALLTKLDPDGLKRAVAAVAVIGIIMAALIGVTHFAKDVKVTLITLTVAIGILTTAIGLLSMINPEGLNAARNAISMVIGMFALLVGSTKFAKNATGTVLLLLGVVAGFAAILTAMSYLNASSSLENAKALSLLLITMSGALAILSAIGEFLSGGTMKGMGAVALLGLLVAELAAILGAMSYLNINPSIETAKALSLLLITMSGALVLLSAVGMTGPAAFIGIGALAALIAGMGAIIVAFGALANKFDWIDKALDKGIEVFGKIGTAIGTFFGSIVSGFAGAATSNLPDIATTLSDFMSNLSGFIEGAKNIDDSVFLGISSLTGALLELTGAGLIERIATIFNGGTTPLETFGNVMVPFSEKFAEFADNIKDIKPEAVTAAATASKTLAEFANNIPNSGGAMSLLTGDNKMDKFGEQLVSFSKYFVQYSEVVKGVDGDAVTATTSMAQSLSVLANDLPNTGGLVTIFTGDNNIATFGLSLVLFAKKFVEYSNEMANVNGDAVSATTVMVESLTELAKEIPNSGGLVTLFTGDNNFAAFGASLLTFAKMFVKYSNEMANVDTNAVNATMSMVRTLVTLASGLSTTGGLKSLFAGDNSIARFGNELVSFGQSFKKFSESIKDVKAGDVEEITKALSSLIEAASKLDTSKVEKSAGDMVGGFIDKVSTEAPKAKEAGANLIGNFATGFGDGISNVKEAASSVVSESAGGLTEYGDLFGTIGNDFSNILASGLQSGAGFVEAAGGVVGQSGASGAENQNSIFNTIGNGFGQNLAIGLQSQLGSVSGAGSSVGRAGASGASSTVSEFSTAGSNMAAGLASGIRSGVSSVISAALDMAKSGLQAAKDALGIQSPSRAFMAIGRYIGEGLAIGIRDSAKEAVNASADMANKIASVTKKSFEDIEKWVEEAKYFDELSLEEELELWNRVIDKYREGTEERLKAEKNAYSVYKELGKEGFEASKQWISDRKYYNELSLEAELAAWERMQSRYKWDSEERKEIDKEIYRVKNELTKQGYENSKAWMDKEKAYNRLTTEDELSAWERIRDKYWFDIDIVEEATEQIYKLRHELIDGNIHALEAEKRRQQELLSTLVEGSWEYINTLKEIQHIDKLLNKANYENSENWIAKEEKLDRMGLADKLAAKRREIKYEGRTAEDLEKLRLEEYEILKEINEKYERMQKDAEDAVKEHKKQMEALEKEKADKIKDINEKLAEDIDKLNDEYDNKLKSRTDALYKAYGLFDEVSSKDKVKGSKLMKNLQDQVAEFEDWDDILNTLSGRGLNSALMEELQEMGPSAIEQLKALNSLSDSQLAQYADLWADKHQEATDRAAAELSGFRKETDNEIEQLKIKAQTEIDGWVDYYAEAMNDLETETNNTLAKLQEDFRNELHVVQEDWDAKFKEMGETGNKLLREFGWDETGEYSIDGLTQGIKRGTTDFLEAIKATMNAGEDTANETAEINSPSKKFAQIGMYLIQGLIVGINNQKDKFLDTTEDVGTDAIDMMRGIVGRVLAFANSDIDIQPTIRPVIDLSDVNSGINQMNGLFIADRSMSLGMSIGSTIQNGNKSLMEEMTAKMEASNAKLNDKFSEAMDGVRSDIADLVDEVSRLQVVLDGDTLVGAISPKIDRSLGVRAKIKRRGSI